MRVATILTAAAAAVVTSCSEGPAQQEAQAQQPGALAPGMYEASWTVTELRSTDKTDPATSQTVGATGTTKACVREGPVIDPALFAEDKDECRPTTSYARGGRLNLQMQCKRPDEAGPVMQTVTGTSTADSFEGEISTSTYLTGYGDYSMVRTVKGRRVGDCTEDAPASET